MVYMQATVLLICVAQMSCALAHLHKRGIVHLDVKPDNIYKVDAKTYKLGDFGMATLKSGAWGFEEGDARHAMCSNACPS